MSLRVVSDTKLTRTSLQIRDLQTNEKVNIAQKIQLIRNDNNRQ